MPPSMPQERSPGQGHAGGEGTTANWPAAGGEDNLAEIPAIVLHVEVGAEGGSGESSEGVWEDLVRAIAKSRADMPITLGGDGGGGGKQVETSFRLRLPPLTRVDGPGTVKPLVLL